MSLDRTTRKVVYQGDGKTTVFPFAFKVFAPSDIAVEVGTPGDNSRSLSYGSDYTVKLNAGQEENPGGTVTVAEAPASGLNLAVVSAIPALQPMVLTPDDMGVGVTVHQHERSLSRIFAADRDAEGDAVRQHSVIEPEAKDELGRACLFEKEGASHRGGSFFLFESV